jgi:hypothetical protein
LTHVVIRPVDDRLLFSTVLNYLAHRDVVHQNKTKKMFSTTANISDRLSSKLMVDHYTEGKMKIFKTFSIMKLNWQQ